MQASEYDYQFKIGLVGSKGAGKTSLFSRYVDNNFSEEYRSIIGGVDFKAKTISVDFNRVKLDIWDYSSDMRSGSYYDTGCTHACIIVFDVTNGDSFNAIRDYQEKAKKCIDSGGAIYFLVATKCDLKNERKIGYDIGRQHADRFGFHYVETSAKTGENVDALFQEISMTLMKSIVKENNSNKAEIVNNNNKTAEAKKTEKTLDISKLTQGIKSQRVKSLVSNLLSSVSSDKNIPDKCNHIRGIINRFSQGFTLDELKELKLAIEELSSWGFVENGPLYFLKSNIVSSGLISSTSTYDEIMQDIETLCAQKNVLENKSSGKSSINNNSNTGKPINNNSNTDKPANKGVIVVENIETAMELTENIKNSRVKQIIKYHLCIKPSESIKDFIADINGANKQLRLTLSEIEELKSEIEKLSEGSFFSGKCGPLYFLKENKISSSLFSSVSIYDEIMRTLEDLRKGYVNAIAQENKPSEKPNTNKTAVDVVKDAKPKPEIVDEIPVKFCCPITFEIMRDPVMTKYGHNFERSAIEQHLQTNKTCPLTRKPLDTDGVFSNLQLKEDIAEFLDKNPQHKPIPPAPATNANNNRKM